MRRPGLLYGCLTPGSTGPILLLPHNPESGGTGGAQGPPANTGTDPAAGASGPSGSADNGFPGGTPVEAMNPTQQAAYWRHHARKHEDRAKESDAWRKANEATVAEHARMVEANRTESEKALAAATATARAEGERAGRAETIPQLVAAEFRAATGLTAENVADLLAPLDKTYFLAQDGSVDTAKVTDYCTKNATLVGGGTGEKKLPNGFPDLGQGNRGNSGAKVTGKEAGLAEAEKRFGKKPAAQSA